jgi:hypothetical protein
MPLPDFNYFLCAKMHTHAKQPAGFPPAAVRHVDREIQFSGITRQARLLELDCRACFFKLFLEVLGVVFRYTFFDG